VEKTKWASIEFAQQIDQLGVGTIVFTDVSTDGMLSGPNIAAVSAVCAAVRNDVIASGGVSQEEDVRRLQAISTEHPNLIGVIVGKALYDGRVALRSLQG
jgi:phosphoribosylformimino-5-aminoimidazole carboxamide ribotide isomerase